MTNQSNNTEFPTNGILDFGPDGKLRQVSRCLFETPIQELSAASLAAFKCKIQLAKDDVIDEMRDRGLILSEPAEAAIAQLIEETVATHARLVQEKGSAVLLEEVDLIREAKAMLEADEISERRYRGRIDGIKAASERQMAAIEHVSRQLLANLADRIRSACQSS